MSTPMAAKDRDALQQVARRYGIADEALVECLRIQAEGSGGFGGTLTEASSDALDGLRRRPLGEVLVARGHLDEARREGFEAELPAALQEDQFQRDLAPGTTILGPAGDKTVHAADARARADAAHGERPRRWNTVVPEVAGASDAPAGEPSGAPRRKLGKYELVAELGHGGMGVVYKAWHPELKTHVAIKVLLLGDGAPAEMLGRFAREARASARLHHPGIVQVFDVGKEEHKTFIVMEYVEGADLDAVLANPVKHGVVPARWSARKRATALPASPGKAVVEARAARPGINFVTALQMTREIAEALQAAHAAGVVHRDLKPLNVLRDRAGRLKVMDFGLARLADDAHSGATLSGTVMGTLAYMSPEQAEGKVNEVDAQSDVYQIGATLYELLTGRPPFSAESRGQLHLKVIQEAPEPPREVNPAIDRDAETICLKAMAREKAKRYATAADLAEDCRRYLAGEPILARPAGMGSRVWSWVRRHRIGVAAASLLTGAVVTAGTIWYFTPGVLDLVVKPAVAVVRIGDRTWTAGKGAPVIRLAAGGYAMNIEAPDFTTESREFLLHRGQTRSMSIDLRHETGLLEATCLPKGSEIVVDDIAYGSVVRKLPLDTGPHRVRAWAEGRFEKERTVAVAHAETAQTHFWLEEGLRWQILGDFGLLHLWPDVDGDGAPDLLRQEMTDLVIRSSADGRKLWTHSMPGLPSRGFTWFDLGGSMGKVILFGRDPGTGVAVECLRPRASQQVPPVWTWSEPARAEGGGIGVTPILVADLTGDGVGELAVSGRHGNLWVLNGSTGELVKQYSIPALAVPGDSDRNQEVGWSPADPRDRNRMVFRRAPSHSMSGDDPAAPMIVTIGCIRIADGVLEWVADFDALGDHIDIDLDGDGVLEVILRSGSSWKVLDLRTGVVRWKGSHALPDPAQGQGPICEDLDGDGISEWLQVDSHGHLIALRLTDDEVLWNVPAGVRCISRDRAGDSWNTWAVHEPWGDPPAASRRLKSAMRTPAGDLVCVLEDSLAALDPRTGAVRWRLAGHFAPFALNLDWDGDGKEEILAAEMQTGLLCIDGDGRRSWTLRLGQTMSPEAVLPDLDGDGLAEICVRTPTLSGIVRCPSVLWSCRADSALLATPVVVRLPGDPSPCVVQLGIWPQEQTVACFDGATGGMRWSLKARRPRNRPPALADWNGDGVDDLVYEDLNVGEGGQKLYVTLCKDGTTFVRLPIEGKEFYSTPVIADFNGDGAPDFATQVWDPPQIQVSDGRTGKTSWAHKTGAANMGTMAATDLNGDGRPDVVAPSFDGNLYALNGPDGKVLWAAPFGGGRAAPAFADLNGDGTPDAAVVAGSGTLWIVDGRNGAVLGNVDGKSQAWGRPTIVQPAGGGTTVIVAAQGGAGVVAYDWTRRKVLWRGPAGEFVGASPVVADLDGDGRLEVVVGAAKRLDQDKILSSMIVLDMATGERLWGLEVGEVGDKVIEADPVVADLDGDGVQDILIATGDGTLQAISGVATRAARKRREETRGR